MIRRAGTACKSALTGVWGDSVWGDTLGGQRTGRMVGANDAPLDSVWGDTLGGQRTGRIVGANDGPLGQTSSRGCVRAWGQSEPRNWKMKVGPPGCHEPSQVLLSHVQMPPKLPAHFQVELGGPAGPGLIRHKTRPMPGICNYVPFGLHALPHEPSFALDLCLDAIQAVCVVPGTTS